MHEARDERLRNRAVPMSGHRVLLIGGKADGDRITVDYDRCSPGEQVRAIVRPPMPLAIPDNSPDMMECHVEWYRIAVLHLSKDRVLFYGVPLHWKDEDGLIALFGLPSYL